MKKKNPLNLYEPHLLSKYKRKVRRPVYRGGGYRYDTWVPHTTIRAAKISISIGSYTASSIVSENGFRLCRTTKGNK